MGKACSIGNGGRGILLQAWDIKYTTYSCCIVSKQINFRKKRLVLTGYLVHSLVKKAEKKHL